MASSSKGLWHVLGKIVDRVSIISAQIAAVGVFFLMALMTLYVVTRKMSVPIPGAFHLSEQMVLVIVLLPGAIVAMERGHISLDLISNRFPRAGKWVLEQLSCITGMVLCALIAWFGWILAFQMLAQQEFVASGTVQVPVWPFRFVLAFAFSAFLLQILVIFIRNFKRWGEDITAPQTIGEDNVEESMKLANEILEK